MIRSLSVAVCVVAAHLVCSFSLTTETWAWHHRTTLWEISALTIPVAVLILVGRMLPISVGLLAGASIANGISSIALGAIPNYFVVQTASDWTAYNLPDVCLYVGGATAVITTVVRASRVLRSQRPA